MYESEIQKWDAETFRRYAETENFSDYSLDELKGILESAEELLKEFKGLEESDKNLEHLTIFFGYVGQKERKLIKTYETVILPRVKTEISTRKN